MWLEEVYYNNNYESDEELISVYAESVALTVAGVIGTGAGLLGSDTAGLSTGELISFSFTSCDFIELQFKKSSHINKQENLY